MGHKEKQVDVLIVGAGPVGLLTAYMLARCNISTHIVEQHERTEQVRYGRAAMIAPRTLELLDQLGLTDTLSEIGFVCRGQASFKDGKKTDNVSAASSHITDTFFDFLLLCRQRYTEETLANAYEKCSGDRVQYGTRLRHFTLDKNNPETPVLATFETKDNLTTTMSGRYIVGADGGHSQVRTAADIPFEGEHSNRRLVRIDGIVETNMPEARRGICAIQSKYHGSVLWASLDHRVTRVGFALPEKLWEEVGTNISLDDLVKEAKEALQPFTLEFKTVEWWTVYSVGQRLAGVYSKDRHVFIAGDAAHTHSSGAAQGMNTGVQDAFNLSWKLAGCIQGWLGEEMLDTYEAERRQVAKQIIDQDKIISLLIAGIIPESMKENPQADPYELLTETYNSNASLNTGMGIAYPPNDLIATVKKNANTHIKPGERVPDVLVHKPGVRLSHRLYPLIAFDGKFKVLVFVGNPNSTSSSLKAFERLFMDSHDIRRFSTAVSGYVFIMVGDNGTGSPEERLGTSCAGALYYDIDGSAHKRYGISNDNGAVLVVRPDMMVGAVYDLDTPAGLVDYLTNVVAVQQTCDQSENDEEFRISDNKGEVEVDI